MEAWLAGASYTPMRYGKSRSASLLQCVYSSCPLANYVEEQQLEFEKYPICYERGGLLNERDYLAEEILLF